MLADEMIPRDFVASRAGAGQSKVFKMKSTQVAFRIRGRRALDADLERRRELVNRDRPSIRVRDAEQTVHEFRGDSRHAPRSRLSFRIRARPYLRCSIPKTIQATAHITIRIVSS